MLTHEELMDKCQELREAVDALLDAMRENDYIYDSYLDAHVYYMDNMIDRRDSLWTIYLENRDSISDEDAEVIIRAIVIVSGIHGLALGGDKKYSKRSNFKYFM